MNDPHPLKVVLAAGHGVDLRPERDINDAAAGSLRQGAIDNLTDRLKTGGMAGRLSLRDLIDADLDQGRINSEDIYCLLTNYDDRHLLADRMVDGLIERHLATNPDLIEEEAAAIERDRDADGPYEDAVARGEA